MDSWLRKVQHKDKFKLPVFLISRKSGVLSVGPFGGNTGTSWNLTITQDYKETKKSYLVSADGYKYRLEKSAGTSWQRYDGIFILARIVKVETAGELFFHIREPYEHIKERNRGLQRHNRELRSKLEKFTGKKESRDWQPVDEGD